MADRIKSGHANTSEMRSIARRKPQHTAVSLTAEIETGAEGSLASGGGRRQENKAPFSLFFCSENLSLITVFRACRHTGRTGTGTVAAVPHRYTPEYRYLPVTPTDYR